MPRDEQEPRGETMMWVRSFLFGILAFAMLALMGIKVRSAWDVAGFVLGATAFWILVEKIVFSVKKSNSKSRGQPPITR